MVSSSFDGLACHRCRRYVTVHNRGGRGSPAWLVNGAPPYPPHVEGVWITGARRHSGRSGDQHGRPVRSDVAGADPACGCGPSNGGVPGSHPGSLRPLTVSVGPSTLWALHDGVNVHGPGTRRKPSRAVAYLGVRRGP